MRQERGQAGVSRHSQAAATSARPTSGQETSACLITTARRDCGHAAGSEEYSAVPIA